MKISAKSQAQSKKDNAQLAEEDHQAALKDFELAKIKAEQAAQLK